MKEKAECQRFHLKRTIIQFLKLCLLRMWHNLVLSPIGLLVSFVHWVQIKECKQSEQLKEFSPHMLYHCWLNTYAVKQCKILDSTFILCNKYNYLWTCVHLVNFFLGFVFFLALLGFRPSLALCSLVWYCFTMSFSSSMNILSCRKTAGSSTVRNADHLLLLRLFVSDLSVYLIQLSLCVIHINSVLSSYLFSCHFIEVQGCDLNLSQL